MRTPSSRHSIPGPPASPRLSNTIALASMAVMLRARSLCILARREHNSVLHATPTCHPYWWCWWCWWCAGAGITLERHSRGTKIAVAAAATAAAVAEPIYPRLPSSLTVHHFCQFEATPQSYQFSLPKSPRPLPVRLIGAPTPLRFLFPTAATAYLREGVRLNPRFPLSYCSVVSIYLANDCCAFVCHPA